ncbi:MAG: hypothetical protein QM758_10535 [Armatimonas sp.]
MTHRRRERGMALTASMMAILLLMTILLLSTMTLRSGGDVVSNSDNALRHTRRESERATAQQLLRYGNPPHGSVADSADNGSSENSGLCSIGTG